MDLRSNHPYWFLKSGIIKSYPSIQKNENTEVVIMGAGITGALVCWYLNHAGIKTIVVDKRHVGTGSTAASTALLQYEIDTPLTKLCDMVGEQDAVTSYQLCINSITEIQKITTQLKEDCGFIIKPSLQYASTKKDVDDLEKEYALRLKHTMPVQWLEANEIEKKFGFKKEAAILSSIGAGVDAYELTHAILNYCIKKFDTKVFDKTEVKIVTIEAAPMTEAEPDAPGNYPPNQFKRLSKKNNNGIQLHEMKHFHSQSSLKMGMIIENH